MDADLLLDRLFLISDLFERDMARAFAGTELSRERGGGGPRDVLRVGDGGGGGPGMTTLSATAPSWAARAWSFVRRAVLIELRIYESIGRAIVRRPKLPPGATGFRYHQPVQRFSRRPAVRRARSGSGASRPRAGCGGRRSKRSATRDTCS